MTYRFSSTFMHSSCFKRAISVRMDIRKRKQAQKKKIREEEGKFKQINTRTYHR